MFAHHLRSKCSTKVFHIHNHNSDSRRYINLIPSFLRRNKTPAKAKTVKKPAITEIQEMTALDAFGMQMLAQSKVIVHSKHPLRTLSTSISQELLDNIDLNTNNTTPAQAFSVLSVAVGE